MMNRLGNIELDKYNFEFNSAAEFVQHTNKFIYLTGKAGTGKTTFLKYIKATTNKNTVVLAPTGVAAINAGGRTIHSFFQIPLGPFVPGDSRLQVKGGKGDNIFTTFRYRKDKRKIIENLELLIIDEVSMVRADLLDVIDKILRAFRRKSHLPFGGVQVILIGDTFQLSPIANSEEWTILSQFYRTPFFFSSKVVEQNSPIYIELKKIYRQSDQEFIDLLNRVRVGRITQDDLMALNSKFNPTLPVSNDSYIILATHNKIVNGTNLARLNQLGSDLFTYEASVIGDFPEKFKPTDHFLRLKVGAQVMFVKNDSGELKRYYNGKIGKIKKLEEDAITVVFDDRTEVELERDVWHNIKYTYNKEKNKVEEEVVGTFMQFPIRLAWAITVHKSQGLTFEKVVADLGNAFAPGQVYVALSRCTSFSGLQLKSKLSRSVIKTDPDVLEFAKNETPETLITEQLTSAKADFYYKRAIEQFEKGDVKSSFDFFRQALRFRNDIDTENFERFIVVKLSRLLTFRHRISVFIEENVQLRKGIEKAQEEIDRLLQNNYEKEQIIEEQEYFLELLENKINEINVEKEHIIKEQDYFLKLLERELRRFKGENNFLKQEVMNLTQKVSESQKHLQTLRLNLKRKELELIRSKRELEIAKSEVERLKNLKWYDKLFGMK